MKTKKQQLTETPETYSNNDHSLELFFSEKLNKFCLQFNGELYTYKTWNGFVAKRNYFIEKYDLVKEI